MSIGKREDLSRETLLDGLSEYIQEWLYQVCFRKDVSVNLPEVSKRLANDVLETLEDTGVI